MTEKLRPTGIEVIGDIPWGTHFCHFYETEKDLLSILVPYFKAGLENNEYCIWVTSGHTTIEEALNALGEAVPNLEEYIHKGCIEILTHTDWYLKNGRFELDKTIHSILDRLRIALSRNFDGLRLNGDEAWLDRKKWHDFIAYESALNPAIAGKRLIISCTYPLDKCEAADVLDIAAVHESVIARRKGKWEILEAPQLKRTKAQIQQENERLEVNVAERTKDLAAASHNLAASQANLQTIFKNTDIAFLLLDSGLHVVAYNAMATHWSELSFGVSLEAGVSLPGLLSEARRESAEDTMQTVLSGTPVHYEADYPLQDGSPVWYSISINPVKNPAGHVIGLCLSATDITSGKLGELERAKITDDLVQRNKDLEQFAYIISHNLRAPLANIIGLAQLLRQDSLSADEKTELEQMLSLSIENLDRVIGDLNQLLEQRR
jgi:PAS domain-containing protein